MMEAQLGFAGTEKSSWAFLILKSRPPAVAEVTLRQRSRSPVAAAVRAETRQLRDRRPSS
jgi:hypothetical protein